MFPERMKLEYFSVFHQYLTAVYHTPNLGWQYTIFLQDGSRFAPGTIYESAKEACSVAKKIIHLVVSCDRDNTLSY